MYYQSKVLKVDGLVMVIELVKPSSRYYLYIEKRHFRESSGNFPEDSEKFLEGSEKFLESFADIHE